MAGTPRIGGSPHSGWIGACACVYVCSAIWAAALLSRRTIAARWQCVHITSVLPVGLGQLDGGARVESITVARPCRSRAYSLRCTFVPTNDGRTAGFAHATEFVSVCVDMCACVHVLFMRHTCDATTTTTTSAVSAVRDCALLHCVRINCVLFRVA